MFNISHKADFRKIETAIALSFGFTFDSIDETMMRKEEAKREGNEKALEYFSEKLEDLTKLRSQQEGLAQRFGYGGIIKEAEEAAVQRRSHLIRKDTRGFVG